MPIRCTFHPVSNIHRHFGNRESNCAIYPELFPISIHTYLTHNCVKNQLMIRKQNIKGTFLLGPLFFKWMGYFSLC